ncbi:Hypothetical predicted protein [Mytilus galloprovincialis]|uniref:Cadherin domain-containing protein n=1 Tax=Mytilus galloprovincialis TaxID=29158 RepID=A0A8B6G7R7_MYTGA|nr:Hypothetical predicted protein [Mytilus galloprovincialis]
MTALDGDDGANSAIVYSFTAGENMIHFALSSSGVITVNSALDAATQSLYYLTVSAIDGGTPSLTGTCKVRITISDINDQTPSFSAAMYNLSLSELVNVNDIVFPFRASDADTGPNSIITYSIASGNGDFRFSIDPLTGDLKLAGILDRETTDSYVLEVQASDSGIPVNTGTTVLSITVKDANDNDPVYTSGSGTQTLYVTTSRTSASATGQSNGTSAVIRVDSVTPNLHLVVLKHSVTADVVEAQKSETTFYVVESTAADTIDGIENEKNFMTQSDLLTVLSQGDGTPASVLETAAFTSFPVTSVEPYIDTRTSSSENWAQTTVGIAVITTIICALVLLALILILYFWFTRNTDKEYSEIITDYNLLSPVHTFCNIVDNNDKIPYLYANSPLKMELPPEPVLPRSSTPVFKGLQNNISNRGTKPKKDKHSMTVSMMNFDSTKDNVPPALFQDGKYMKENPNADVGREGTITPRQILIESKRSFTGNYSY